MTTKKIFYCIVVIVTFVCFAVDCKNSCRSDQVSVPHQVGVLQITNERLLPILDSIIQHEKKCVYYSSDLVFSIHRQAVNDSIAEFQIGGIGSMLVDLGEDYYKGCFEHKGHTFLVVGQDVDTTIFADTDEQKEFRIYKTDWVTDRGETVLIDFEDDQFSYWVYHYLDSSFYLKILSDTYCNCYEL